MTSTTLYKKDTKGKTRVWTIQQEGDKYRTITGVHEGKLITSEWTVATPMNVGKANATTGEQQAAKEVASEIKSKKEKNYVEHIDNVDVQVYKSPMLAHSYDDYGADLVMPVASQPKLDGIRCTVDDSSMLSRNGKLFVSCPHILAAIAEAYKRIRKKYPKLGAFRFDGELYNHRFKHNFNRICELVKRTKPSDADIGASADLVEFWCYDIFTDGEVSFEERSKIIAEELKDIPGIVVVPTTICKNEEELNSLYEEYIGLGYEGQIVRVLCSRYQFKRTKDLLKRKEFKDGEWQILSVVEGIGNRAGTAGYMTFKTKDGADFKSNIKGSFEWMQKLLKEQELLIGKMATIKYFNLTPDGVPRFPYVTAIRDYE